MTFLILNLDFDVRIRALLTLPPFLVIRFGLVDLKEGHLAAARPRLAEVKSFLTQVSPGYKAFISFLYDLLSAEILWADGSLDKAVGVTDTASPLGRLPVMQNIIGFNIPFMKDVLARAYKEKGQVDDT